MKTIFSFLLLLVCSLTAVHSFPISFEAQSLKGFQFGKRSTVRQEDGFDNLPDALTQQDLDELSMALLPQYCQNVKRFIGCVCILVFETLDVARPEGALDKAVGILCDDALSSPFTEFAFCTTTITGSEISIERVGDLLNEFNDQCLPVLPVVTLIEAAGVFL